ncbi:MAG: shikimate dehydrogenase [Pseudomonadota bacterium]
MFPTVQGNTDVYLISGFPVEQVRAPEMFNLIFRTLAINAVLVPVHVAPENICNFVQAAFLATNVKGMLLTIPHKSLVMGLLSGCNDCAKVAGAVNGIRRNASGKLEGGLFDGLGFVASLDYFDIAYAGKRVLMVGAGGAAAAIAASLAIAGERAPAEIALFDPMPGKAAALASHVLAAAQSAGHPDTSRVFAAASGDPAGFDVVINASPLGLKATDPLPFDVSRLDSGAAVLDILMKNQPTPLVQAVRARQLVAEPGFEMMIQQAPDYLEFFGLHQAAQTVRQDATFIREQIYPASMAGEIHRPAQPLFTLNP